MNRAKYYDNHTLYVTSGVAREEQLHAALRTAIKDREVRLNIENITEFLKQKDINVNQDNYLDLIVKHGLKYITIECDIKVNLIVNKNGEYYGFGYVRVSNEEVYWMLLGRNPDGTERVIEYPDPNWSPPAKTEILEENVTEMSWFEIAQEEDKYIHPVIKEDLGPLMVIPGYKYDVTQYKHLQEMAIVDGKDPSKVPTMGYFEFSRAYTRDLEPGKISNVLCAKQIPDWIPAVAFKNIFRSYSTSNNIEYPTISITDNKKDGRMIFITFDPFTKDAMFSLLMTRKVRIKHPDNSSLKCTVIFDHACENPTLRKNINEKKYSDKRRENKYSEKKHNVQRDDIDINKYNYAK